MKFGHLILRKIIKIIATRCQILIKCTKFDFGCGSAPDPAGGAYVRSPDPLSEFKGAYRGREGKGWGKGARDGDEGGKEEGRREGMEVGRGKGDRGNG